MYIYVNTDRSCSSVYNELAEYLFVLQLDGTYLILNNNTFISISNRWCYFKDEIYVQLVGDVCKVFDKLKEDIRKDKYSISDYVITRILKLLPYFDELKQYVDEILEKTKECERIINDTVLKQKEIRGSAKYEINIDNVALVKKAIN